MAQRGPVDRLPDRYALAIRLRDEGIDHAAIGRVLAIEVAAVPGLLEIADRKLREIGAESGRGIASRDREPGIPPDPRAG